MKQPLFWRFSDRRSQIFYLLSSADEKRRLQPIRLFSTMVSKEKGKNKSKTPISSATEGSKPVEGDATFKCHPTGTLVRVYAKPGARRADVSGTCYDELESVESLPSATDI